MATISLNAIEYVTLYTGDNSTDLCTCNCPCCSQKKRTHKYQGNMQQAIEMFDKLPNLKQLYIFGNPDVTVDTDFCHDVMKEGVRRNIQVCFSTSGIGGKKVLSKLLKDIPTNMVDYVSFSFDGINEQEMSIMKGIKYPMNVALDGLNWTLNNGYNVKVQPTLWSSNYQNTAEIIEFFAKRNVKWFTFHIGSLESGVSLSTHQHLTPEQIKEVHKQISESVNKYKDIKVRCPIIYMECGNNEPQKWYCMYPERAKELLVLFTEDGIKVTHAPIASGFRKDLMFLIEDIENVDIPALDKNDICPFSKSLSGRLNSCCRYISRYWNYE